MGQLKKTHLKEIKPENLAKPPSPSPDKSVVDLLQQLSRELDLFFEKPEHYPREKIIDIAKSFLNALAKTIDEKALVKSESWTGINFENLLSLSNWLKWMKRARHVLQSDEVDDYGCDPAFKLAIKPFFDFLYDTTVDVRTVYGKHLTLKVKAGTKPGTKFKISGKGRSSDGRTGDMYVIVDAKMPKIPLDSHVEKMIEAIRYQL
jgi:hypothetical protein